MKNRLLDVLLSVQKNALRQTIARQEIRTYGPLADIEMGELGEFLKLSDLQKEELLLRATEVRELIGRETRKLRDEAIAELLLELPKPGREVIKRLMGKPLDHGDFNLFNFSSAVYHGRS